MRIIISQKDLHETKSGIQKKVLEEVKYFISQGHEVYPIAERIDSKLYNEVGAHPIKTFRWPFSKFFRRKFYMKQVDLAIKKIKPDLIIGHGDIINQDIAYIHNCVHLAYEKINSKTLPKESDIGRIHTSILEAQTFTKLICNSQMMKKDLAQRFTIPLDKIEVIYPEYDPDKFNIKNKKQNREEKRASLGLNDEIVIGLITSGNFKKRNVAHLIESINLLDDTLKRKIKVIVAGKDKATKYSERIKSYNLTNNFIFLPSINNVETYYHAIDIFVLPALIEEFGRSVLEAMACGLPVIISSDVGSSEILEDKAKQFVLHSQDPNEFKEKLEELIGSEDLRLRLGALNSTTAFKYSSVIQANKFAKMLRKVLEN